MADLAVGIAILEQDKVLLIQREDVEIWCLQSAEHILPSAKRARRAAACAGPQRDGRGLGPLVLALLLALGGCSFAPASHPVAPTETPPVRRPFQERRDAPVGRAAQLTLPTAAESEQCSGRAIRPGAPVALQLERPAELTLCFEELAPEAPLALELRRPDGQIEHGAAWADAQGRAVLHRSVPPDEPQGAYELTGLQAEQTVHATLNVARAAQPRALVLPAAAERGTTFRAHLSGLPAHALVTLDLYQAEGAGARYRSPLAVVQADGSGQAALILPSRADDPPGSYWISATLQRDQSSIGARFELLDAPPPSPAEPERVGQVAVALDPLDFYVGPDDQTRVLLRPRLYRGTLVAVLQLQGDAVQVRTLDDAMEGWLHDPGGQLALGTTILGAQARYVPRARLAVTDATRGIPLRAEPSAAAAKRQEVVRPGEEATLLELRGDWVRVTLAGSGAEGWLRWYYDGARYVRVRD